MAAFFRPSQYLLIVQLNKIKFKLTFGKKTLQDVTVSNKENNILEFNYSCAFDVDRSRELPSKLCATLGFVANIVESEAVRVFRSKLIRFNMIVLNLDCF